MASPTLELFRSGSITEIALSMLRIVLPTKVREAGLRECIKKSTFCFAWRESKANFEKGLKMPGSLETRPFAVVETSRRNRCSGVESRSVRVYDVTLLRANHWE